ncbi:MFS transporter permease [Microbacterium sp. cx-55]|uniref:MFS transporter permease n=1 Tax=unclassified Microbacterium TaxID=2609290 RepID=UPI001CBBECDA|nr:MULTISPECIES: MFS transporter permease [unclassified Microbacterium]MBZ4486131.1 MFS transporter permease [Microbacterium sp. cx-55]MCC4907122.1 MFS transporter permease [Microbacterium sp. cx-59]UGB33998.1 MFS transporter permease [Microbacterium sp. cx-55]
MWLRRAFFNWLFPAAFALPLWLFVGWGVFNAGGWAFLWVLFIAIPSVFLGQIALTLITRSRPSVRAARAVSWGDVAGIGVWHALTIALGFYVSAWWAPVMVLTVVFGVVLIWWQLRRLWREAAPSAMLLRAENGATYIPAPAEQPRAQRGAQPHEVIVVEETAHTER